MPLNEKGRRMLKRFIRRYGKEKGTSVFYAWKRKNHKVGQYEYSYLFRRGVK